MDPSRFFHFTQMVDVTQKCIKRIEASFAPRFGVKSVHIFWLHVLRQNPQGLTATELAHRRMVDRSLISREMDDLKRAGLVQTNQEGKSYNAVLTLTEKGQQIAEQIGEAALAIQHETSNDISEEEIVHFYTTFEKIRDKLIAIAKNTKTEKENNNEQ